MEKYTSEAIEKRKEALKGAQGSISDQLDKLQRIESLDYAQSRMKGGSRIRIVYYVLDDDNKECQMLLFDTDLPPSAPVDEATFLESLTDLVDEEKIRILKALGMLK